MSPGQRITGPSQIEWAEALLLGDGTDLVVTNLTGWDTTPGVDSGNVPRASRHGAWAGRVLAQERTVTVEFDVLPESQDTAPLLAAIRAVTAFSEDGTERALVVAADDGPPMLAYGQVMRRDLPMDPGYRRRAPGCAIQWTCSDPRRYALNQELVTIARPSAGTGLTYPLTYPLDYGTAGSSGTATVRNSGDAPTQPVFVITGPAVNPMIVNTATGAALGFGLTLAAGETLTVDTGAGTVLLGGTGNRLFTLSSTSVPVESFVLLPGETSIALRAGSFPAAGASLTVAWRSASW